MNYVIFFKKKKIIIFFKIKNEHIFSIHLFFVTLCLKLNLLNALYLIDYGIGKACDHGSSQLNEEYLVRSPNAFNHGASKGTNCNIVTSKLKYIS
jgi:hypothetical protein